MEHTSRFLQLGSFGALADKRERAESKMLLSLLTVGECLEPNLLCSSANVQHSLSLFSTRSAMLRESH